MHINRIHLISYVKSLPKELKQTYLLYIIRYLFAISFGLFLPIYIYQLTNSVFFCNFILFFFVFIKSSFIDSYKKFIKKT